VVVVLQLHIYRTSQQQLHMHFLPSVWICSLISRTDQNANVTRSVCFLGGPLVNKIGVKWALVLGSMSFPIEGSAYYCNSKFGNQWVSDEVQSQTDTFA
jgi:hypothetical protein